jgi:RecA/RadA recombinase
VSNKEIFFHTGSDLMDLVVGGGVYDAYPAGRIINIIGDKSSGKTFLVCELVAWAYHNLGKKFKWIYDDCESGFTHDTKAIYGFEIMPEKIKDRTKSKNVQDLFCNVSIFLDSLKSNECGMYIVDSLDGLKSKEHEKRIAERIAKFKSEKKGVKSKKEEKGSYQMDKAKYLSQEFFPGVADLNQRKNCLIVILSQTRDKINSLFKEQTRNGGKAMDFYCFCCLWLANIHKIKKLDRTIGVLVKVHAKKSKTPRPYRECVFPLYFTYGIDNIGANLDFLYDLRGKDFELLSSAKSIEWEKQEGTKKIEIKAVTEFLEENKIDDIYQEWADKKEIKTKKDKLHSMVEYIQDLKDDSEIKISFKKQFGQTFTRDELINYIETNKLQAVLTEKVRLKWEQIESEVRINRPGKYQ